MNIKCIKDVFLECENEEDSEKGLKVFACGNQYDVYEGDTGLQTTDDTGEWHWLSDTRNLKNVEDMEWFFEHFEILAN